MNTNIKKYKIIFWISTIVFVAFDSGGALFFNAPFAVAALAHLGFPYYFGVELALAKIIGGIVLIVPQFPSRLKEWAYVGFGISLFSAFIANVVVDGWLNGIFPIIALIILKTSYYSYHKLEKR